jgi:hypothetical protein
MSIQGNVNTQQVAVMSNLASAESLNDDMRTYLDQQLDQQLEEQQQTQKPEESALKKATQGKNGEAGKEIMTKLASKLNQTMPADTILSNLKQDYELLFNQGSNSDGDSAEINLPQFYVNKAKKHKQNSGGKGGSGQEQQQDPTGTREAVRDYVGAYSQMLVNGGSEVKKKLNKMESDLLDKKGVSLKQLNGVKANVANTVREEILKQVKRQYLKQICANPKSLDKILAKKGVQDFIDNAFFNHRIGGYDFGNYKGNNLRGAVKEAGGEVNQELQEFIDEKLDEQITRQALGADTGEVEGEIDELLQLGKRIGFDVNNYLKDVLQKKDDLGLLPVLYFGGEMSAETGMNNPDGQQGHNYEYSIDEEKEILTDKLRAIYLHRALHGDLRSVLQTQFKMIKTQNGLIKLGVKNFDQIEKEGRGLAKFKLFEMLREAFEERATYAKLNDSAAEMTEKKIKTILRNLEKMGVTLSQMELDAIRDKANERMYREAEHELFLVNTAIKVRGELKFFTTKRKTLEQAMERIANESGFSKPGDELGLVAEAA